MAFRILRTASFWSMSWSAMTPIGRRNSEWMVCPPTLSAATPVGAQITICFCVCQFRWLSSVDLPVPARPVTNTCSRVPSIAWNTAACSRVRVTFCTGVFRSASGCRSRRRASMRAWHGAVAEGGRSHCNRVRRACRRDARICARPGPRVRDRRRCGDPQVPQTPPIDLPGGEFRRAPGSGVRHGRHRLGGPRDARRRRLLRGARRAEPDHLRLVELRRALPRGDRRRRHRRGVVDPRVSPSTQAELAALGLPADVSTAMLRSGVVAAGPKT